MLLRTAALFLFLLFPVALMGQTTQKEDVLDGTLTVISHGDYEALEAHYDRLQRQFERGEIPADFVREAFNPFYRADLDMAQFAEDWLSAAPDSPYAQMALTWALHRFSWMLRGDGLARNTYPDALHVFGDMQRQAWQLASAAYETNPRLIPASDALIRLANPNRQQSYALDVFERVMTTDPNTGSLERALAVFIKGWGGRYKDAAKMCDTYGAQYWDAPKEPVLSCKIAQAYRFQDQRDWIGQRLAKGDLPHLNEYRLHFLLEHDASEEEARLAYEILSDESYTNYQWASFFDGTIGPKYGLPSVRGLHWRREYDSFRAELKDNPYSAPALFKMMEPELAFESDDNGLSRIRVTRHPDLETVLEYSKRLIAVDPYNPETWKSYADAMHRSYPDRSYFDMEPYQINVIITANHSVHELTVYMQNKVATFDVYQRLEAGTLPKGMDKAFDGASLADDILCPFMRALRIRRAICKVQKDNDCLTVPEVTDTFLVLENEAKRRGICRKERTLPAQSLAYTTMTYPEDSAKNY